MIFWHQLPCRKHPGMRMSERLLSLLATSNLVSCALEILQQALSSFPTSQFLLSLSSATILTGPLCVSSQHPLLGFKYSSEQGSVEGPSDGAGVILLLLAKRLPWRLSRRLSTPWTLHPPGSIESAYMQVLEAISLCRGPGLEAWGSKSTFEPFWALGTSLP